VTRKLDHRNPQFVEGTNNGLNLFTTKGNPVYPASFSQAEVIDNHLGRQMHLGPDRGAKLWD